MILLDTHVLLWWVEDRGALSATAARLIDESTLLVSPITVWEIGLLERQRRVQTAVPVGRWISELLEDDRIDVASLTPSVALAAARLPDFHRDPADRFLYATAREMGVAFVSKDQRIIDYAQHHGDVRVVW